MIFVMAPLSSFESVGKNTTGKWRKLHLAY